jgi:hypothetical protein
MLALMNYSKIMPAPGCCNSGVASRPRLPREATAIAPIARRIAKAAGFDEVPAPKDYKNVNVVCNTGNSKERHESIQVRLTA